MEQQRTVLLVLAFFKFDPLLTVDLDVRNAEILLRILPDRKIDLVSHVSQHCCPCSRYTVVDVVAFVVVFQSLLLIQHIQHDLQVKAARACLVHPLETHLQAPSEEEHHAAMRESIHE